MLMAVNMPLVLAPIPPYLATNCLIAGTDGTTWQLEPQTNQVALISADGSARSWALPTDTTGQLRLISDHAAVTPAGAIWLAVGNDTGWHMTLLDTQGQYIANADTQTWDGVWPHNTISSAASDSVGGMWYADNSSLLHHIDAAGAQSDVQWLDVRVVSVAAASDGGLWLGSAPTDGGSTGDIWYLPGVGATRTFVRHLEFTPNLLAEGASQTLWYAGTERVGWIHGEQNGELASDKAMSLEDLTPAADGTVWALDAFSSRNPLIRIDRDSIDRFASPLGSITSIAGSSDGSRLRLGLTDGSIEPVNLSADLLGTSVRVVGSYGQTFTQRIASFVDLQGSADSSAFSATIAWGDATEEAGVVTRNEHGGFDVTGSHQLPWGTSQATVTVTELAGAERRLTVTSSVYVIPPALAGISHGFSAVGGREFSGVVAQYTGVATDLLDRYSATVNWGDGTSSEAHLVVVDAKTVNVIASHVYAKPGYFDYSVNIAEADASFGAIVPLLLINDRYPGVTSNMVFGRATVAAGAVVGDIIDQTLTCGVPTSQVVARFTFGDSTDDVQHYRATIDFGDGRPATEATLLADGQGGFAVRASAVALQEGYQPLTVRIYDRRIATGSALVGLATKQILVRPHLSVAARGLAAASETEFSGTLGSFTSEGTGTLWDSQFTATINWGDGTIGDGNVVAVGQGQWEIRGRHTYSQADFDRHLYGSVTVHETRTPRGEGLPGGSRVYEQSRSFDVQIAASTFEGFTLQSAYEVVSGDAGASTDRAASLLLGNENMNIAAFTGEVVWSDGVISSLTFTGSGRHYSIQTTRPCLAAGSYTGTVSISYGGSTQTVEVTWFATQTLTPLARVEPGQIAAIKGVEWSGIVGRFRITDASADSDGVDASIFWGDGEQSSGTIARDAEGWWVVRGSHTYASALTSGALGLSVQAAGRTEYDWNFNGVNVTVDPTRINAQGRWLNFRQREAFTSVVATFTSPLAGASAEQYEAWIDWGDGQRSRGVISRRYDGAFDVSGTVTYQTSGSSPITVTITGPGGSDVAEGGVYLERNPVIVDPATILTIDGLRVSGQLGAFTDEDGVSADLDSYRITHAALIDWGDGEISWGLIQEQPDGAFMVKGDHEYQAAGDYQLQLVVRQTLRHLPLDQRSTGRFDLAPTVDMYTAQDQTNEQAKRLGTIHVMDAQSPQGQIVWGTTGDDVITISQEGDQLLIEGVNGGSTRLLASQLSRLEIKAGKGNDRVTIGSGVTVPILIRGGAGNDTLIGNDRADTLVGGPGDDSLLGGAGNDLLIGLDGADSLFGGQGDDVLEGGMGPDLLRGQRGDDLLMGNRGRDTLYSGQGQDTLQGGRGEDWIYARNQAPTTIRGGLDTDHAQGDTPDDILTNVEIVLG